MMKERTFSADIANAINDFLTNDDWRYSYDEARGIFRFTLGVKGKLKKLNYLIAAESDSYIVYATCPIGADVDDSEMLARMAEFICRANYGLKNGAFELDMNDGEIRYKVYVACEDAIPSDHTIKRSIACPAAMFDRYGTGITDVIFGHADAKEAVQNCEKPAGQMMRALLEQAMQRAGADSDSSDSETDIDELMAMLAERLAGDGADDSGEDEESA